MRGVRSQEKYPGEFRRSQNWIGGHGSAIKNARYVPPTPEDMMEAMSDLEKYLHTDSSLDVLIRAALLHYQFETIHPFLDGNGRIGRLLVTLFLMEQGALSTPALYISYFLKMNRAEYYDRMTWVRNRGDYEQWVSFFLRAVYESARDAIAAIERLSLLHERNMLIICGLGRSRMTALKLFDYLEENPIINIQKTASALGTTFKTASNVIARLCDAGILEQTGTPRRNRTFSYRAYLEILREGT
jgi:Fic family protein